MPLRCPSAHLGMLLVAPDPGDFHTYPVPVAEFDLAGNRIVGDARHTGITRVADTRSPAYRRGRAERDRAAGLEIPDWYDAKLAELAQVPGGVSRLLLAQCLGLNVVVAGFRGTGSIPGFLDLVAGVDFGPYDPVSRRFTAATVMITRTNDPCIGPGRKIEGLLPGAGSGLAKRFVNVARGRRGYVGMIAKQGSMAEGQLLGFVPFGQG